MFLGFVGFPLSGSSIQFKMYKNQAVFPLRVTKLQWYIQCVLNLAVLSPAVSLDGCIWPGWKWAEQSDRFVLVWRVGMPSFDRYTVLVFVFFEACENNTSDIMLLGSSWAQSTGMSLLATAIFHLPPTQRGRPSSLSGALLSPTLPHPHHRFLNQLLLLTLQVLVVIFTLVQDDPNVTQKESLMFNDTLKMFQKGFFWDYHKWFLHLCF